MLKYLTYSLTSFVSVVLNLCTQQCQDVHHCKDKNSPIQTLFWSDSEDAVIYDGLSTHTVCYRELSPPCWLAADCLIVRVRHSTMRWALPLPVELVSGYWGFADVRAALREATRTYLKLTLIIFSAFVTQQCNIINVKWTASIGRFVGQRPTTDARPNPLLSVLDVNGSVVTLTIIHMQPPLRDLK